MSETAPLAAYLWLLHALVAAPIVGPLFWFTRRRIRWHAWEALVFVVPFAVWFALMLTSLRPKSLANIGECFFISIGIVTGAFLRALLGKKGDEWHMAGVLVLGVSIAAGGTYLLTPLWPE